MIKKWCAHLAHWNSQRHLRLAELWSDINEWLLTPLCWRVIRQRRADHNAMWLVDWPPAADLPRVDTSDRPF